MWPFKKKPDWRLVHTIKGGITLKGTNDTDDVHYYLYENQFGDRKMECKMTNLYGYWPDESQLLKHPIYFDTVYPWVKGLDLSYIESYWDVIDKENERCVDQLYKRLLKNKYRKV